MLGAVGVISLTSQFEIACRELIEISSSSSTRRRYRRVKLFMTWKMKNLLQFPQSPCQTFFGDRGRSIEKGSQGRTLRRDINMVALDLMTRWWPLLSSFEDSEISSGKNHQCFRYMRACQTMKDAPCHIMPWKLVLCLIPLRENFCDRPHDS